MRRKLLLLAGLSLSFLATGCCLCDAPYDYCGPTFLGGPCEECVTDARMNSVFTPYPGALPGEVAQDGLAPQSVLQPRGESGGSAFPPPDVESPKPPATTTQSPRMRSMER
jgi:hypothetical protein